MNSTTYKNFIFIFLALVSYPANGYTYQNLENSNPTSASQLLLQAADMVHPSHIEALLNIAKLQALAGDDHSAKVTFERIENNIRTLPLHTSLPNSEESVLERNRYHYYVQLAITEWESGYASLAMDTIALAREAIDAIQHPSEMMAALKQFFLAQVQLKLSPLSIHLMDKAISRDQEQGNLTYQKVEVLLSISQALQNHGRDHEAIKLLQDALLRIEGMDYDLSRSTLLASLLGLLLKTQQVSTAEEIFFKELARLNQSSLQLADAKVVLEKVLLYVEVAKGYHYLGNSIYSYYINRALEVIHSLPQEAESIRSSALRMIAKAKVIFGDIDGALEIEESILDKDYKNQSLPSIAEKMIANGELVRAKNFANRIGHRDPTQKAFILSEISIAMAKQGDIGNAFELSDQVGFPFKANIYYTIMSTIVRTKSLEDALTWAKQKHIDSYYKPFILMGAANGLLTKK